MPFVLTPPIRILRTPGGFRIADQNGARTVAYIYCREQPHEARAAGVFDCDEAEEAAKVVARALAGRPVKNRIR